MVKYIWVIALLLGIVPSTALTNSSQNLLFESKLAQVKVGEYQNPLLNSALSFVGTPYQSQTLEINQQEALVVNLQALDCTTYIENALALSFTVAELNPNFESFSIWLKNIRYRDGVINGYVSRLHYFTEWLQNNQSKGFIKLITKELGGELINKPINFMSTHPSAYQQLDKQDLPLIELVESRLSVPRYYLPIDKIAEAEQRINSGDIIAITTNIKGLDVTHTGFAWRNQAQQLHLLHASTSGEVVISTEPLLEYLRKNARNTGIMVARVIKDAE